jgi:hypothetical protein
MEDHDEYHDDDEAFVCTQPASLGAEEVLKEQNARKRSAFTLAPPLCSITAAPVATAASKRPRSDAASTTLHSVALIGGPCGGKTSAISILRAKL